MYKNPGHFNIFPMSNRYIAGGELLISVDIYTLSGEAIAIPSFCKRPGSGYS